MLAALALLAAIEAVPAPTVELTLTGSAGAPVSAAPRSLSDVARERREGRKAVGGFSAVETTVRPGPVVPRPELEWAAEETTAEAEPEVATEPPPAYVETYVPGWIGGGDHRHKVVHRHSGAHVGAPRPAPRPAVRPSALPGFPMRPAAGHFLRQRPG